MKAQHHQEEATPFSLSDLPSDALIEPWRLVTTCCHSTSWERYSRRGGKKAWRGSPLDPHVKCRNVHCSKFQTEVPLLDKKTGKRYE